MIVIKTRQPDPELEQKIRMLLEREHIEAEQISIDSWEKLVLPGLTLDGMTHEVSCNGRKVSLTRLEFDLLLMLASHEGQIFSKEELFRAVWGQSCDDTLKVVANTVSNLRKNVISVLESQFNRLNELDLQTDDIEKQLTSVARQNETCRRWRIFPALDHLL